MSMAKGIVNIFVYDLERNRPLSKIPQYSLFVPPEFCINIVSIFSGDLRKNKSNTYRILPCFLECLLILRKLLTRLTTKALKLNRVKRLCSNSNAPWQYLPKLLLANVGGTELFNPVTPKGFPIDE